MKHIALVVTLALLAGCVGSPTPHNPMTDKVTEAPWWQASTVGVSASDNPWEIYVRPAPQDTTDDPWSSYKAPPLFPEGWKPAKLTTKQSELRRLRKHLKLFRLRRQLRREKWLEKKRLERLMKRSIVQEQEEGKTY